MKRNHKEQVGPSNHSIFSISDAFVFAIADDTAAGLVRQNGACNVNFGQS